MRFVFIIVLCAPLILSSSDDGEFSENEIPVDEPTGENVYDDTMKINESDFERENWEEEQITLEEAYKNSVQAYLDEDWDGCIEGFDRAMQRYKDYKRTVVKCRRDCREKAAGTQPIFPENVEDLHFYEKKVHETLCLLDCNQNYRDIHGPQSLKRMSKEMEQNYAQLHGYEYLHICHYQKNHFQDAANAVYTFLALHPKHEMNLKNLRYYVSLPEVSENEVTNLEVEPFLTYYMNGVNAYDENRYDLVINNLEKSLNSYLKSEEDCRFYCEGHFDQGWYPEFTPSVANHFAYCLKCKRGCSARLNTVNGEYRNDLLPSHYHYLQIAYFKSGDAKKACAAVASYLLFYPSDETMLANQEYYRKLPKVDEDYFTPRKEAVNYVKRQEYELRLLLSISEEFHVIGARLHAAKKEAELEERKNSETQLADHPPPGHSPAFQQRLSSNDAITWKGEDQFDNESVFVEGNSIVSEKQIRLVAGAKDLGGELRYLAEGFLNGTECESLIHLAQIGAVEGDGYEGNATPHSMYERFEGLTLGRAALMVYFGLIKPDILELALSTTEEARDHVERYFNLDRHLYFTYTHLACRSALPDSTMDRQDLSHAIHADNCIVAENGTCSAEWPAYTFRDYSAIIYLNDDFTGGEFVFSGDSKARVIQSTVKPSCGRMVAFSASGDNLHGVRGVLRGKRCALALWFTFEKEHLEIERILARAILSRVRADGTMILEDGESVDSTNYEDTLSDRFDTDPKLRQLFENLRSSKR